jgi:hypothetical protein
VLKVARRRLLSRKPPESDSSYPFICYPLYDLPGLGEYPAGHFLIARSRVADCDTLKGKSLLQCIRDSLGYLSGLGECLPRPFAIARGGVSSGNLAQSNYLLRRIHDPLGRLAGADKLALTCLRDCKEPERERLVLGIRFSRRGPQGVGERLPRPFLVARRHLGKRDALEGEFLPPWIRDPLSHLTSADKHPLDLFLIAHGGPGRGNLAQSNYLLRRIHDPLGRLAGVGESLPGVVQVACNGLRVSDR